MTICWKDANLPYFLAAELGSLLLYNQFCCHSSRPFLSHYHCITHVGKACPSSVLFQISNVFWGVKVAVIVSSQHTTYLQKACNSAWFSSWIYKLNIENRIGFVTPLDPGVHRGIRCCETQLFILFAGFFSFRRSCGSEFQPMSPTSSQRYLFKAATYLPSIYLPWSLVWFSPCLKISRGCNQTKIHGASEMTSFLFKGDWSS